MFFVAHIYLMAALLFFVLWLTLLSLTPKKQRGGMVRVSLLTMVLGYFVEQMHLTDWWQPHFLFNTPITIEDVLFGFSIGGIVYAIYGMFCRRLRITPNFSFSLPSKIALMGTSIVSLFGLFYILNVHSFWASIVSLCIPIAVVGVYDRHLFFPMFLTSVVITAIAFCGYLFSLYINPQFVTETYLPSKLSGVFVLGIPIEELVWFFVSSMGGAAFLSILNMKLWDESSR
jgi:hypothetical protein